METNYADLIKKIRAHLSRGGSVMISTHTKATVYDRRHVEMFKLGTDGHPLVQRGKHWDSFIGAAVRFEFSAKNWPDYVPTGPISWLIGNKHVGTPDAEIEKEIRERLSQNKSATEEMIQTCVNYALYCHHENQGLYADVMSGNL